MYGKVDIPLSGFLKGKVELGDWLELDLTTPLPEKEEEDALMDMEEPPPPPGLDIECSIPEALFSEEEAGVTNSLTLTMVSANPNPDPTAATAVVASCEERDRLTGSCWQGNVYSVPEEFLVTEEREVSSPLLWMHLSASLRLPRFLCTALWNDKSAQ